MGLKSTLQSFGDKPINSIVQCSANSPDFVAIPIGDKHKPKHTLLKLQLHIVVGTKSGDFVKQLVFMEHSEELGNSGELVTL